MTDDAPGVRRMTDEAMRAFEEALDLCEQLHSRTVAYGSKETHDAWIAARSRVVEMYEAARQSAGWTQEELVRAFLDKLREELNLAATQPSWHVMDAARALADIALSRPGRAVSGLCPETGRPAVNCGCAGCAGEPRNAALDIADPAHEAAPIPMYGCRHFAPTGRLRPAEREEVVVARGVYDRQATMIGNVGVGEHWPMRAASLDGKRVEVVVRRAK